MTVNESKIVRAIDVGYGNTKFVNYHTRGSAIQCSIFPSITPHASGSQDLNGGIFQRRNTVKIENELPRSRATRYRQSNKANCLFS